jgi:hypothetical protein
MTDQGLPASLVVGVAVLAYGLGLLSLFALQHFMTRQSARRRAAARRRHPSHGSASPDAVTRVDGMAP